MSDTDNVLIEAMRKKFPEPFRFYNKYEICNMYGLHWRTIKKRLANSTIEAIGTENLLSPAIAKMIYEDLSVLSTKKKGSGDKPGII